MHEKANHWILCLMQLPELSRVISFEDLMLSRSDKAVKTRLSQSESPGRAVKHHHSVCMCQTIVHTEAEETGVSHCRCHPAAGECKGCGSQQHASRTLKRCG